MANIILKLYDSLSEQSEKLLILTNFILKDYASMWFQLNTKSSCIYGAKHLNKTMSSHHTPVALKRTIDPLIQEKS